MKNCESCKKDFEPKWYRQKFCSQSCAAKFNNSKIKKRARTKRCKKCGKLILAKNVYCPSCIAQGAHLGGGTFLAERTIQDVLYEVGSNRYGVIRSHARLVTKTRQQQCHICQYDKHVETCHIKDIGEFSLDTKVGVVNHPNNLVLLCPNHHWEFDRGILKLVGSVGYDPTTPRL